MVVKTAFYAEKIRNSFTSHIKYVNCIWIKYLYGRIVQVFFTKLVKCCKAVSPKEWSIYLFLQRSLCVNVLMDVYSKFYGLILYFVLFINYPLKQHINKLINSLSYDKAIISSWDINKHLLHVDNVSPAKSVKYRCAVASIRPSVRTTRFHRFFIIWKDRD